MGSVVPRLDAKVLYRRLDSLLGALHQNRPQGQLLELFLEDFFKTLKDDLHLRAAALYAERRDDWELLKQVGDFGKAVPETLDSALSPLQLVFRHRVYIFADPGSDDSPHHLGLLPCCVSAALIVGKRPKRHIFLLLLADGWQMEELDFSLNTVRAALGSRLVDERVRGSFLQAAEIQQSLLLEEPPAFPGYELACRSVPTEEVGGDFFDFHSFDGEMLGLAIGDASGHGLPAALLVRDVVTGLRMGIEKELKVAHVFAKLNRVIHRSTLSSRFVSVFYGELEPDGNFVYINAGHHPPLLFSAADTRELDTGGTVIGPLPEARFRRGFARVEPGNVLVLCTDGILERRSPAGEHFATDGLTRVVRAGFDAPAEEILDRIFEEANAFGDGRPWEDDATAVVVRRSR